MEKVRNNKIIADRAMCVLFALFVILNCREYFFLMDGGSPKVALFCDFLKNAICAALIGGAADLFAVKALFGKVGPFPHTDILRKEREDLTKAIVELVTKDLMTIDNINSITNKIGISDLIIVYLKKYNGKGKILELINATAESVLREMDFIRIIKKVEKDIRLCLNKEEIEKNIVELGQRAINSNHSKQFLGVIITISRKIYNYPEFQHILQEQIKIITDNYDKKSFGRETVRGLAYDNEEILNELNNLVNDKLKELEENNNSLHKKIKSNIENYLRSSSFMYLLLEKKDEVIIDGIMNWMYESITKVKNNKQLEVVDEITLKAEYVINRFMNDREWQKKIDEKLKKFANNFVANNHYVLKNVFYKNLNAKSDEEYLREIKVNAGNEIQSIRFSGMAVGGVIGAVCFIVKMLFV